MTKLIRLTGVATTALTAAALVAGCGGGNSTETTDHSGHSATATATATAAETAAAATKPAKDLALTAAELPAGITAVPVGQAQLQQSVDQLSGAANGATITPASCGSGTAVVDAAKKLNVSQLGMAVGTVGSGVASESVIAQKPDVQKLRDSYRGACTSVTAEMSVQGQKVRTQMETTVASDAPKTPADDLLVIEQTATSQVAGQSTKQRSIVGIARVGAYAVSVVVMSMDGTPDRALFDKLLVASIDKVAKG
ncbi:hypothetical protein [Tsukamurella sp. NPDC003166]|uniref:hypothetical protein n=1 Tax=Tsukamurella sp. NPDC003166 TaxID=3154444 RepID=UPI0033B493C4